MPAATVSVPSAFSTIPPAAGAGDRPRTVTPSRAVPETCSVTSVPRTATPFSRSLPNTLSGVVPPDSPFCAVGLSGLITSNLLAGAVTVMLTVSATDTPPR